MEKAPVEKWLPIQKVAEILGCTDKYVYQLIQDRTLKAMKLGERALRVSEQSLNDFIKARIVDPADYFAPPDEGSKSVTGKSAALPQEPARSNWMKR